MNTIVKFLKQKLIKVKKEKILIPCLEGHFLENRCALITGSSSGIGYSIAEAFLKNGATVIITGRNQDKLKKAKNNLLLSCKCDEERIVDFTLDISKLNSLEECFNNIIQQSKTPIDIFVNNAGVNGEEVFPYTSEEEYDKILDTNLKGYYFMSQLVVKYMVENKIQGNILNVSSSSALRPAISPYMISKWGIKGLTLGMAKKYLPYGIIVNGIAPGNTATPMVKNEENLNDLSCDYNLVKRYIAPEEIANISTILVSSMGKMIVGDTIYITGGSGVITYDDMIY